MSYRYEKIESNEKVLFPFVEELYVMIMENSPFENQVKEQLKKYSLCKNMYLQWNKGFKNCKKNLQTQTTVSDLMDAYITICNKTKDNKYVIILEEDFIVREDILQHNKIIGEFIEKKNPEIFLFGSFIWQSGKIEGDFVEVIKKGAAHALLLNNKAINKSLEIYNTNFTKEIFDLDIITNKYFIKYTYNIPTIIQIWRETDNQKNWGTAWPNYIQPFRKPIMITVINFFNLHGLNKKETVMQGYYTNYLLHTTDNPLRNKINNFVELADIFT